MAGAKSIGFSRVPRQRLSQVVAEQLLETIRRDGLEPGTKLPAEHELMAMLNVGRSTVREALNGLSLSGIVEIRHGQGYYVAATSPQAPLDLELALRRGLTVELMEARLLLEPQLAALAAERATPEEHRRMEDALLAYERTVAQGQPTPRLGHRFHELILEAAHNDVLMGFVRSYTSKVVERGEELEKKRPSASAQELREHRAIFEAIKGRDAISARQRAMEHLTSVREEYISVEQPR